MTEHVVTNPRPLAAVLASAVAVILIVASHRHPNLREGWSVLAALVKFAIVASMLPGVLAGTVYEWRFETFLAGIDFTLQADPLGMLFALLASFLWIGTAFYATGYMRGLDEHAQTRFFASFAASLSTAIGIAFAGNLVTIFVFYELLSLVTYPLVAHNEDGEARIAGRKYLFYTFFGGGVFLLAGTVLVYWLTAQVGEPTVAFEAGGMTALTEVASAEPGIAQAAFFLLIAGFGVKAAVMPLHSWLADAMVAPTPVSGLLHAVAVVKSGAFGVSRVILEVYGVDLVGSSELAISLESIGIARSMGMNIPVAVMATVTLVAASIIALRKDHLKRRLAYSTTAQLSYIVLGLSLLHPFAVAGALFHIPAHAFAKLTLFFCAGAIHVETHTDYISEMAGIGKRMPVTMAAFTLGAVGMAGLPPIAGFVSKFYMLIGAVEVGGSYWLFAAALLLSGVLNIAYFWPVVYTAFFESEDRYDAKPLLEFPPGGLERSATETVATDGGNGRNVDSDEAEDDGESAIADDSEEYTYAVDKYPSDHTVPSEETDEDAHTETAADSLEDESHEPTPDDRVDIVDHHGDHDDHHTGGMPAGGWERPAPLTESTWLMLVPIVIIATGAVVLGTVPGSAIFLDLVITIVEDVTGVVVP